MTPVTRSSLLIAGAALAVGVSGVVPAVAEPPSDPVSGLVGTVLGHRDGGPAHHRKRSDLGHTRARDGVLRRGCHDYPYRYAVEVGTNDWTLETYLVDRTGETIASGAYMADSDPKRGRAHFRFCRYSTRAGKFTIRAKLN